MAFLHDLLAVVALCGSLLGAGLGLQRLLRVPWPHSFRWSIAPPITQAWWACLTGAGVAVGIPVWKLAWGVWIVTAALVAYQLWAAYGYARRPAVGTVEESRGSAPTLLALGLGLTVVMLLPFFRFGLNDYLGSGLLDGWSYVAYGQYLWHFPRGTEGGLAPLYQWAAHLSSTRHVTSAELGVLSIFYVTGETHSAMGLIQAGALFSLAAASASLARAKALSLAPSILYVVLAVATGWTLNVIWANNFDNLLAMQYLPALVSVLALGRSLGASAGMLLGVLLAGALYTYPEFSAVTIGCVAVCFAERLWHRRAGLAGAVTALVVTVAIVAPYADDLVRFVIHQARTGLQTEARPGGGMFPGLLDPASQLSAFWAIGTEYGGKRLLVVRTLVGAVLLILASIGFGRLIVTRQFALAVVFLMFVSAVVLLIEGQAYAYGAYKMIVLGWWIITWALVYAVVWMRTWPGVGRGVATCAVVACLTVPVSATVRSVAAARDPRPLRLSSYDSLRQLYTHTGGEPVGILVDDVYASHWAVYFLRGHRMRLGPHRVGYLSMAHVQRLLSRSEDIPWSEVRVLLRDANERDPFDEGQDWRERWRGGTFVLWEPPPAGWAIAHVIHASNGVEAVSGRPFFWLGGRPFEMAITTPRPGAVELGANFVPGPGVDPAVRGRQILVSGAGASRCSEVVYGGPSALHIPVDEGATLVSLAATDAITIPVQPNGDSRPLALGVSAPSIRFLSEMPADAAARCTFESLPQTMVSH